ncbi:type II secretion system protein M [Xylophilus sp. Kf1]|nr:type II secretion system protein M [Xylophilus sp. Kf1]
MKRPSATSSVSARAGAALAPLRARWALMSPRERYLSSLAASAVGILLVWAIALAPALKSLQKSQAQRLVLDSQLQQMMALQTEARQLAAQPRLGREAGLRALRESVAALGAGAQMQTSGERAVVTLQAVPAVAVANWLGQARTDARAIPVEVRLVRSPARASANASGSASAASLAGRGTPPARPGQPGAGPSDLLPNTAPAAPAVTATPAVANDARWDGTVVLVLPAP